MAIKESFKTNLKELFCSCYAEIVKEELDGGLAADGNYNYNYKLPDEGPSGAETLTSKIIILKLKLSN